VWDRLDLDSRQIPDRLLCAEGLASSPIASAFCIPRIRAQPFKATAAAGGIRKVAMGRVRGISLCFIVLFSLGELAVGCASSVVFTASVVSARKSWKTYKENCNRAVAQDDKEAP